MTSPMVRSGAWVALDNLSAAVLSFLFFVITARFLSPVEFGIAAIALSLTQLVQPAIDSLFHDAIIQKKSLSKSDVAATATFNLAWSCLLALALCGLSPAIASLFAIPELATYLPWMGLCFVASGFAAVPSAEARREMKFRWLAIRTIAGRLLGVAVGLWMLRQGYGVWAVIAQAVLSSVSSAVLLIAATGIRLGRTPSAVLRPLLLFSAPLIGTQLLQFGSSRLVTLIIGATLGPVASGTWNVAFRFIEPFHIMLATIFGQVTLPLLSRRQEEIRALRRYFLVSVRLIAMFACPAFVGLALVAPDLIQIFVGEKWAAAAPLTRVVAVVTMLLLLRQAAEITLTAAGHPKFTFYTHAASVFLSTVGTALGALLGLLPAVIGWSSRALPFLTINIRFVARQIGITMPQQLAPAVAPLLACCAMAAAVVLLRTHVPANPLVLMLSSAAVGAPVYLLALFAIDRRARIETAYLYKLRRDRMLQQREESS